MDCGRRIQIPACKLNLYIADVKFSLKFILLCSTNPALFNNPLRKIKRRNVVVTCAYAFLDGAHRTSQESGSHGHFLASRWPLNKYAHIPLLQGRLRVTSSSCTCMDSIPKSHHILVKVIRQIRPRHAYIIQSLATIDFRTPGNHDNENYY